MGHFWQNIYNGFVTDSAWFFLAHGERLVKPCYRIVIMQALAHSAWLVKGCYQIVIMFGPTLSGQLCQAMLQKRYKVFRFDFSLIL